jgi:ABC-type multidrug transport system fused ATPase/permease subunit
MSAASSNTHTRSATGRIGCFCSYWISGMLMVCGIVILIQPQWFMAYPEEEDKSSPCASTSTANTTVANVCVMITAYRLLMGSLLIVYSLLTTAILQIVIRIHHPQREESNRRLIEGATLTSHTVLGIVMVVIGLTMSSTNFKRNADNHVSEMLPTTILLKLGSIIATLACLGLMTSLLVDIHKNNNNKTNEDNSSSHHNKIRNCYCWRKGTIPRTYETNVTSSPNNEDIGNDVKHYNDLLEPLLAEEQDTLVHDTPTNTFDNHLPSYHHDVDPQQQQDNNGQNQNIRKKGKGIQRLLKLAQPQKLLLVLACIVLLIRLPFSLAMPHLVSTTFSHLTSSSPTDYTLAVHPIACMLVVGTIDALLDFWCVYLFGLANLRVTKQLRLDLYRTLLGQEMSFFDTTTTGELTSRLTADCGQMASDLTWVFRFSIEAIVRVTIIIVYLLVQCPKLGGLTIIVLPVVAIVNQRYGYFLQQNSTRVQSALANANSVAQEAFSCIRTVLTFATEDLEYMKYAKTMDLWFTYNRLALYVTSCYYMLVPTFLGNTITQCLILYAGVILIERGELTPQILLSFMLYLGQLQDYTQQLLGSYTTLLRSSGVGDAVFALLDRTPSPPGTGSMEITIHNTDRDSAMIKIESKQDEEEGEIFNEHIQQQQQLSLKTRARRRKMDTTWNRNTISFESVDFCYPSRPQLKVLSNLTLTIPSGHTVALVGPSGCGKSTMVALIERLYDPVQGCVLVGGIDLRQWDVKEHRHNIGIVTQDPVLFSGSILSNITYGEGLINEEQYSSSSSDEERELLLLERAKEVAKLANAHDFIESFADGYYTQVGERGVGLSGGQKQRIAIARAIWKRPSILLLDEATSALDAKSERLVQEALDRLLCQAHDGNITTIVIAHRLQTVRNADTIVVMSHGRIVEQGSHGELLQISDGIYQKMLHTSTDASSYELQADDGVE